MLMPTPFPGSGNGGNGGGGGGEDPVAQERLDAITEQSKVLISPAVFYGYTEDKGDAPFDPGLPLSVQVDESYSFPLALSFDYETWDGKSGSVETFLNGDIPLASDLFYASDDIALQLYDAGAADSLKVVLRMIGRVVVMLVTPGESLNHQAPPLDSGQSSITMPYYDPGEKTANQLFGFTGFTSTSFEVRQEGVSSDATNAQASVLYNVWNEGRVTLQTALGGLESYVETLSHQVADLAARDRINPRVVEYTTGTYVFIEKGKFVYEMPYPPPTDGSAQISGTVTVDGDSEPFYATIMPDSLQDEILDEVAMHIGNIIADKTGAFASVQIGPAFDLDRGPLFIRVGISKASGLDNHVVEVKFDDSPVLAAFGLSGFSFTINTSAFAGVNVGAGHIRGVPFDLEFDNLYRKVDLLVMALDDLSRTLNARLADAEQRITDLEAMINP